MAFAPTNMTDTSNLSNFIPEELAQSVTPRLFADDAKELVEFLKSVFDATGEYTDDRPSIERSVTQCVMIGDAGVRNSTVSFLYVYVKDADATYQRAVCRRSHPRRTARYTPTVIAAAD